MTEIDFLQLIYNHMENIPNDGIYLLLKEDDEYQESAEREKKCYQAYESLQLSKEQKALVSELIDAIHARHATYSDVVYQMGMQNCFSLLKQLAAF